MSKRLRNSIQIDAEVTPQPSGLRAWFGLPHPETPAPQDCAAAIELAFTGMRWVAIANLVALLALATILFAAGTALSTGDVLKLGSCAAIILACDGIALLPRVRHTLVAWADTRAVLLIALFNAVSAAAWSFALAASPSAGGTIAMVGAHALTLGKLATLGIPAVLGARLLASTAAYAAAGLDETALVAAIVVATLTLGMAMNLTARRQQQQRTRFASHDRDRAARELLGGFERSGRGWFWQTNARGCITYISEEIAARLGTTADALIGTPFATLVRPGGGAEGASASDDQTIEFALGAGIEFSDLIVRAATEEERWWSLSATPILDGHGRCMGFHGSGTDLSEQRRLEADANRLANFDGLTGLPNRVNIRRTLEELLESDSLQQGGCGLFLLDLDRFKNVNDTLGHPMGDALLKVVAQRLTRVVGARGQVGRLGGDEFKVIVHDVADRASLAELADTIIARLSLPYVIDDCSIQIGASVGVAIAPTDGSDPDELTRNADLALYAAKAAGKGVHRFYQPEMHAEANERRALENDLREVLARGQLVVLYQPVVDATHEEVVSFEALIRWEHPERGLVPPAEFIPIAEEIGVIGRIGEWVLRTACHEAAKWPDHLRVAVNLSPIQFASPSLIGTLVNALADSGLAPDRLELELTEGVLLNSDPAIDRTIDSIVAMGVRLSLDDFGTGYSSLAYLQRVPFSKIKIDRSFVHGAADARDRNVAIIRAMVGLAESLGMETVAEGAETLNDIAHIRALGCSQVQGYIFGYPMPAEQAAARAAASTPPQSGPTTQRRDRAPRTGLLRVAELESLGQTHNVMIRNISAHGALVEAGGDAAFGQEVELRLGDGWTFRGDVRWRRGNRFGIRFERGIAVQDFVMGHHAPIDDPAQPDFEIVDAAVEFFDEPESDALATTDSTDDVSDTAPAEGHLAARTIQSVDDLFADDDDADSVETPPRRRA